MTHYNPYVQNLIEMGYDEQDCRNVAAIGEQNVTYPRIIHGRTFDTKAEYDDAVADFINGLWVSISNNRAPETASVVWTPIKDNMFDELWSEIADAPGEIFDLPELRDLEEGKFDVNEYLNSNIDYWWNPLKSSAPFIILFLTKRTSNDRRSQLYRWRCNLPRVGWCYLHAHYRGFSISFLLQFSPA